MCQLWIIWRHLTDDVLTHNLGQRATRCRYESPTLFLIFIIWYKLLLLEVWNQEN